MFDSGSTIKLGGTKVGNLLTDEAILSPGAFGTVLTTSLNGNFTQTASGGCGAFGAPTSTCGYFGADLDLNTQLADRLNATGAADVSGAVIVSIDNPGNATPGTKTLTLISAVLGEAHSPTLALQTAQSAVATYSLVFPTATDIDLKYSITFSPGGLTLNQHSVGNAISAIQTAHIPSFSPIAAALFYQPTVQQLGAVYNSLSGESVAPSQQTAIQANTLFNTTILSEAGFWLFDNEASDSNSLFFGGSPNKPLGYAEPDRQLDLLPQNPAAKPAARTWRVWTTFNQGRLLSATQVPNKPAADFPPAPIIR